MTPTAAPAASSATPLPLNDLRAALSRMALVSTDTEVVVEPLAGGVSSDIFRVDAGGRTFCVKRALPKLKVARDWRAPGSRNRSEVAWLRTVADLLPDNVPALLGALYPQMRIWAANGDKVLIHQDEISDRLQGVLGGYLLYTGMLQNGPQANRLRIAVNVKMA